MRQSELFTKTRKEAPKDEVSKSAQLLIRAGFVHKDMAGVYSMLPLGLLVMKKIIKIIKREMEGLGAVELHLAALQDPNIWKATDRWDDASVDVWFKTKLKNDAEIGLGLTHEDPLTNLMKDYVSSYRDLPRYVYQFQTKFRNELRVKSGLLRGREFLMKDLYSFTASKEELDDYYERVAASYAAIFAAVGLGDRTYRTFASGGVFSKFSDEFQTLCDGGEDTIYFSPEKKVALNKEVCNDRVLAELGVRRDELTEAKAIEVGNIFKLGTRFSEPLGLTFTDRQGQSRPVVMGSYGLGIGRLMGTIVEVLADDHGIVWPASVAPFRVHLIALGTETKVLTAADDLYDRLTKKGIEVLYDDRDLSPGQKFADSDLIGITTRVIVSAKTETAKKLEVKDRRSGRVEMLAAEAVMNELRA